MRNANCVVEILKVAANDAASQQIKIFFYKKPHKTDTTYTPLEDAPTNVVLKFDDKAQLDFETVDDAAVAPLNSGKFASGSIQGVLKFELDGEEKTVLIGSR